MFGKCPRTHCGIRGQNQIASRHRRVVRPTPTGNVRRFT